MNFFSAPEFKVGLLVLIVAGIIAGMSLSVSSDSSYLGDHKDAWFYMDDASGLVEKSAVRMAGIRVGFIKQIKLENGQARIEMVLEGDVPITKSVRIEIRPNGILGDKHVEVIAGDPRDPPLRSGEQILVVDDRASVDRVIAEVAKITKSLNVVVENIKSATEGDTDKPLGRIVMNVERITTDLAEITHGQKENFGEIMANLRDTTDTINELVNDESDEGLRSTWNRSLARIDKSLKNVEDITGKINRGEGTIGKLVNDEKTVEELNTAITGINNFIDAGSRIQTSFDFHSNYLSASSNSKSFLSVQIQPGLDRYYEIGVVDDATGPIQTTNSTVNSGGTVTNIREERSFQDRLKINAIFAKNFYDFTIKGGVIENAGGIGFDYHLLKRKLRLSVEAFDFVNLNVRATARYNVFHGLYLNAGSENLANQMPGISGPDAFIGGGLFLTNDDLKLLLTRMPF